METATIALEALISPGFQLLEDGGYSLLESGGRGLLEAGGTWTDLWADVLAEPQPGFTYGIQGSGPLDLIAQTGSMSFSMKNSARNAAALLGHYSPTHANRRAGWDEGLKTRFKFTYGGTTYYKMAGRVSSIDVEPGLYQNRKAHVEALDWMDQAYAQKIAQLAIVTDQRVDQILPVITDSMPIEPRATDFDTGIETLARFFDTDRDEKMSVASLFIKLMRNELGGRLYLKGDTTGGETLTFENRRARVVNPPASLITLNDSMRTLEVNYDREGIKNIARVTLSPKEIDEEEVVIYSLQSPVAISPGQTVVLTLPYRDPATSRPISATGVVWPLEETDYQFGANQGDYGELNALLSMTAEIGGNTTKVFITNTGGVPGWLNKLDLRGLGIYAYDPQTIEVVDAASLLLRGELPLTWDLEQHDNPLKAEALASFQKLFNKDPRQQVPSVRYLANESAAMMAAALQGEPGSLITLAESVAAVSGDFFINSVTFEILAGKWIWCEWGLEPAYTLPVWVIGTSRIGVIPAECVPVL